MQFRTCTRVTRIETATVLWTDRVEVRRITYWIGFQLETTSQTAANTCRKVWVYIASEHNTGNRSGEYGSTVGRDLDFALFYKI